MATTSEYGFGEYDFPRGWFMIGEANEATRVPRPLRYFGRDLVLYRGESGTPYVTDASPEKYGEFGKLIASTLI